MPVEMIGWIAPRVSSELIPPSGPPFDAEVIAETARIHEWAGFDRVLIGYFSEAPDGFLVGAHAASVTERLKFLLAHRPGFVAPPVAARKLATLDQLGNGRLAVHIIAGGSDADQAKDGDWTDHEARYCRSAEYISLLRRTWTEPAPFDHEGEFYRTRGTYSEIRCRQQPHIPIYGGGGSDAAIRALAPHVARDRGLGGVVLQVAAACDDGTHGGDVNDGAALVAAHQRNRRLGTEDVAHQVDVEDLVPARRARLLDLLVFADAGIVDEDIEAPELLRGTVDEGKACGLGTNVSLREGDLGACGLEFGRHAAAAVAVAIAERHARALGDETPDRRLADSRCPTRHRGDLAVEPSHVRRLSLCCEVRILTSDLSRMQPLIQPVKITVPGYQAANPLICWVDGLSESAM